MSTVWKPDLGSRYWMSKRTSAAVYEIVVRTNFNTGCDLLKRAV